MIDDFAGLTGRDVSEPHRSSSVIEDLAERIGFGIDRARRALADVETNALAPVAVDELATKVVAALDLIAANIPDLRTPHPATAKKVRGGTTGKKQKKKDTKPV